MKKFFSFVAAMFFAGTMMAATTMTCSQAADSALTVSKNGELFNNGEEIEVTGFVTEIAFAWKDSTMSFWMADSLSAGNVLEAYKCAIAKEADAPAVGDKVKVNGQLTKFKTTPEFAEGCTCAILEKGSAPKNLGPKTIAEFLALKNTKDTCVLTGIVANIVNTTYGNFDLIDATDTVYVYGLLTAAGESKKFAELNVAENDTLTVKAVYGEHDGEPQAPNAVFVSVKKSSAPVVDPINLGPKTIAEFLALKNKKDTCILTGVVSNIVMDKKDTTLYNEYGNFDLTDETGTVYVYGLLTPEGEAKKFREMNINEGTEITVKAIYNEYKGAPQAKNAILVSGGDAPDTLNVAEACALALSLGDNETTTETYVILGYVAKIKTAYNEEFGNISFYMTDDATSTYGDLQVYRGNIDAEAGRALAAGDRVAVVGKLLNNFYNDKNSAQVPAGSTVSVEWKQAIENIILTNKVDKIIVDGVVYIVRDGKLFNMQGAQVR